MHLIFSFFFFPRLGRVYVECFALSSTLKRNMILLCIHAGVVLVYHSSYLPLYAKANVCNSYRFVWIDFCARRWLYEMRVPQWFRFRFRSNVLWCEQFSMDFFYICFCLCWHSACVQNFADKISFELHIKNWDHF